MDTIPITVLRPARGVLFRPRSLTDVFVVRRTSKSPGDFLGQQAKKLEQVTSDRFDFGMLSRFASTVFVVGHRSFLSRSAYWIKKRKKPCADGRRRAGRPTDYRGKAPYQSGM